MHDMYVLTVNREQLKDDLEMLVQASIAAICHCYDNSQGLFPDECDCEDRERINESISMILSHYREICRKYNI